MIDPIKKPLIERNALVILTYDNIRSTGLKQEDCLTETANFIKKIGYKLSVETVRKIYFFKSYANSQAAWDLLKDKKEKSILIEKIQSFDNVLLSA